METNSLEENIAKILEKGYNISIGRNFTRLLTHKDEEEILRSGGSLEERMQFLRNYVEVVNSMAGIYIVP